MQDYTYTSTSSASSGAGYGEFMVFMVVFVVAYLVFSFILSKVFAKAGKPAWAAFVPIYNGWVMFEMGGKPGWWILAGLIPFVGGLVSFVLYLIVSLEIAKRFGKSSLFGVFGLWLFSLIGYTMLAFDSSTYQGGSATPAKASASSGSVPEALKETKKDDTPSSPPLVQ
ncbi:DUF805 domain-containing protein [Candidatus Saccharibacteria bacterium]|nr:DUF805 domain-containing protein [Candidatus Saccharibacteria bacterium]